MRLRLSEKCTQYNQALKTYVRDGKVARSYLNNVPLNITNKSQNLAGWPDAGEIAHVGRF